MRTHEARQRLTRDREVDDGKGEQCQAGRSGYHNGNAADTSHDRDRIAR